jgi:hypothetical protein
VSGVSQQQTQRKGCGNGSDYLREPVAGHAMQREMAGNYESECDSGIEMRPADVTGRIDHRGDHQPEDKPDTHMRHLAVREGIDHDRPTPRKDECECANAFGDTCRHEGNMLVRRILAIRRVGSLLL